MLLYKYLSFEDAARVLKSNCIGFSQSRYFNDPFDKPDIPGIDRNGPDFARYVKKFEDEHNWIELTGILCLTRTPTNALMWAHYARGHAGVVIGIDAVRAGFTDEATNLVPAQFGSVIYVSGRSMLSFVTRPPSEFEVGLTYHFPLDQYERLQRLFLQKPLYWAYEEEVRVLKSVAGIAPPGGANRSGQFGIIETTGKRPIYLYKLPEGSIREVYFGCKADPEASEALNAEAHRLHDFASFECNLHSDDFTVRPTKFVPLSHKIDAYESAREQQL
jgi:DUF2971 family protein